MFPVGLVHSRVVLYAQYQFAAVWYMYIVSKFNIDWKLILDWNSGNLGTATYSSVKIQIIGSIRGYVGAGNSDVQKYKLI
jgi:hypothetical protein